MSAAAAYIYWVVFGVWLVVLATVAYFFVKNPRAYGTTRLLLAVLGIDTFRNLVESGYFGVYFGGQYGIFPHSVVEILGQPALLIVPKLLNIVSGCVVLSLLLWRWLPLAVKERSVADQHTTELEAIARIDSLTGIPNRRHLVELAEIEWVRHERYQRPLSLIMLDIDKFKAINDAHGHAAGDKVLAAIALVCGSVRRHSDTIARIGGEEFAVLLPETSLEQAQAAAERLVKAIAAHAVEVDAAAIRVTASAGVAEAAWDVPDFAALMRRADEALYRAKALGRNRVECVDAEPAPPPRQAFAASAAPARKAATAARK
ncbi:MAG TPA: GGDEF domain-containing protein [Roseiarcus sp.]|nr:GGDEF domain-containing protein [Roseiarcus sp.]